MLQTIVQRSKLVGLGVHVLTDRERLGIGLRNRCYGAS